MEDRLLELLESVLGKSKKTSGDNYAFYSPFVDHYKPKLEVNIRITSDGRIHGIVGYLTKRVEV